MRMLFPAPDIPHIQIIMSFAWVFLFSNGAVSRPSRGGDNERVEPCAVKTTGDFVFITSSGVTGRSAPNPSGHSSWCGQSLRPSLHQSAVRCWPPAPRDEIVAETANDVRRQIFAEYGAQFKPVEDRGAGGAT